MAMIGARDADRLGRAMCEQWGLNPHDVTHIAIHWTPREMPYAVVDLVLTEGAVRELLTLGVIERVRIEPAP